MTKGGAGTRGEGGFYKKHDRSQNQGCHDTYIQPQAHNRPGKVILSQKQAKRALGMGWKGGKSGEGFWKNKNNKGRVLVTSNTSFMGNSLLKEWEW